MGGEDLRVDAMLPMGDIWSCVLARFIELYGFFNVRYRNNRCKSCTTGPKVYR